MAKIKTLCFACTLTGLGHFFKEYLRRMVVELDESARAAIWVSLGRCSTSA